VEPTDTNPNIASQGFEASNQKAQNRPSTQLIKAMSCVEWLNAAFKAETLSHFSSYQTLTADKNWQSY
jgi:hypothetical protein